jgi:mannose-6-phosphate isomerase
LLRNVKCAPTIAHILTGETTGDHEKVYRTTAPDFELSVFELKMNETASFIARTTEIVLLTSGRIRFDGEGPVLETGEPSAVVFAGTTATMIALSDSAMVFRASVPVYSGE